MGRNFALVAVLVLGSSCLGFSSPSSQHRLTFLPTRLLQLFSSQPLPPLQLTKRTAPNGATPTLPNPQPATATPRPPREPAPVSNVAPIARNLDLCSVTELVPILLPMLQIVEGAGISVRLGTRASKGFASRLVRTDRLLAVESVPICSRIR